MPVAGDEGYEKLVICPYDKSHEIRRGRMQFHLEKCRRNYPNAQLVDCPYNKAHIVPKQELNFHMEEECSSRVTWERFCHEREEKIPCPVKDLVPVNAATVPDGGENWDNFEAVGSVLNHIKAEAEEKPIVRMLQVASKAKRKAFRAQERLRHNALSDNKYRPTPLPDESDMSDIASFVSSHIPKSKSNVLLPRQDPSKATATLSKFQALNINSPTGDDADLPETSSEYESASTSRQTPFSYASVSANPHKGLANRPASTTSTAFSPIRPLHSTTSRPSTAMSNSSVASYASVPNFETSSSISNSQWRPLHSTMSRPSTAMSNATSTSYGTASEAESVNRPPSAMSSSSMVLDRQRPPNSTSYRQNTAMNIAASAASYNRANQEDGNGTGFCQIPIPGLGRGKRRPIPE